MKTIKVLYNVHCTLYKGYLKNLRHLFQEELQLHLLQVTTKTQS